MMGFAVAFVLTALAVTVILVSVAFRRTAFCPRREALVDVVDGRCTFRATTCPDAPVSCERECIELGEFARRAG